MSQPKALKHFYIPEDQSIYLLSSADAQKLRDWVELCIQQLQSLGYRHIALIGSGAFGFVFGGEDHTGNQLVFKFTRINLAESIQLRLEEEAFMLEHIQHNHVPPLIEFQQVRRQSILVMERATGEDLEQVSIKQGILCPRVITKIAVQLGEILLYLRNMRVEGSLKPIVHGDIKPSNLVWDATTETLKLVDWGSSVFAQLDSSGQFVANNVLDLMSSDMQQTNARLGDIYFIGNQQLEGDLSSPRFDEQGLASTIYALASGQSCRYGTKVITPASLGLPKLLADILTHLLDDEIEHQQAGGDYFFKHLPLLKQLVFGPDINCNGKPLIPIWAQTETKEIDSVVYSSRKSFLRQHGGNPSEKQYLDVNDAQFDRYYKNYLQGMGDTEKAFVSSVSRLSKYPLVGGLALVWKSGDLYVDSSLSLYDESYRAALETSVNNIITLARAINIDGVFKCCLFNAKDTLHIERVDETMPFIPTANTKIEYELSKTSFSYEESNMHSYFEDGDDPDELLELPHSVLESIAKLNLIHHTGCIIFEALPTHLKIHNYYRLLDHSQEAAFVQLLSDIVRDVPHIKGLGISGFMKLPYKNTRYFEHQAKQPDKYYPRNPKAE